MPRKKTGTIEWINGRAFARVSVANGKTSRPRYDLHTMDRATADRRLEKLMKRLEAGDLPVEAKAKAAAPDTVAAFVASLGARLADGDHANVRVHVIGQIGSLPVVNVRPVHIKGVRDKVMASAAKRATGTRDGRQADLDHGVKRTTVAKVLGAMRRLFAAAIEDEIIETNPAADVKLPKLRGKDREVVKPREILSDDEIAKFLASERGDLELKMLSLVARSQGGMRTGDLHVWDYMHIDLVLFAECTVPRSKTAAPEKLAIPEMLRPFLRAWWERAGKPIAGPVFPVRRGKRAGEIRKPKASHAHALRRDLARAGVFRLPPLHTPATKPGTRTDLGRNAAGTKLVPNPRDPLYFETPTSLPVDFHSFRRAFNTALAEAGVNTQQAMLLAGHSDQKTHMRYVARTSKMMVIPEAALPHVDGTILDESLRIAANHRGTRAVAKDPDPASNTEEQAPACSLVPSSKPLVRGSNPFGRAQDFGGREHEKSTPVDDSDTPLVAAEPAGRRGPVVSQLFQLAQRCASEGDLAAAKVLNRAAGELLGSEGPSVDGAPASDGERIGRVR